MKIEEKQRSNKQWQEVEQQFFRSGDPLAVLETRTQLVEAAIGESFRFHLLPSIPSGLCVVAVGGYGRRQLFPYSDVDLLLLTEKEPDRNERAALLNFLQELWDQGFELGHSVRTVDDCCRLHADNLELTFSLLDHRFIAGFWPLYHRFRNEFARFITSNRETLLRLLARQLRQRYARFQNTIFHLEPNIKECPGGLRDYHTLHWLQRIRQLSGLSKPEKLPSELTAAFRFLATIRCFLHFKAQRDSNILTFEMQEELPEQPFSQLPSPEAWMKAYFAQAQILSRHALKAVEALEERSSALFSQFRRWRSRIRTAEFSVAHEKVYVRQPHLLQVQPLVLLRLFRFIARHNFGLSPEAERQVQEALASWSPAQVDKKQLWTALIEVLQQPYADRALRLMYETGVLQALFPAIKAMNLLVIRDFYHRYTVDEHSLLAIEIAAELRRQEKRHDRRFAELALEIEEYEPVLLALLFHDLGKAQSVLGHEISSAEMAEAALLQAGAPPQFVEEVSFLIREHLLFPDAIHTKDLDDPAVIRSLAARVQTAERARKLGVLSYADISAVNPTAMTTWRADQLWNLYILLYRELTRELEDERLRGTELADAKLQAFLQGFPKRYLDNHSVEQIRHHYQLAQTLQQRQVASELTRHNGYFQLTVLAYDRPYVFAKIAGVLASFGMNILKAEAFSNASGIILDVFVFEDPNRTLDLNPDEVDRLQWTLQRALTGKVDVARLLEGRPVSPAPTRKASIEPRVRFDSTVSSRATLIELVAQDRPGLLYDVATVLSGAGCNIETVLIETRAHRALDTIYVTKQGRKLTAEEEQELTDKLLEALQIRASQRIS